MRWLRKSKFGALLVPGAGTDSPGGGETPYDPYYNPDVDAPVFALLGDSITAGNTPTSTGQTNLGYWTWVQAVLGYRAYTAVYGGIGGNTTTQMLARLTADIITPLSAYVADGRDVYCLVMGGVNDSVNTSNIIATATGNLEAIYDALIAAGIIPISCTITPTSSATTATQLANWDGIQSWLRSYCPANSITLCDVDGDCRDASISTSRVWNTDFSWDGVHPTAKGAQAISRAIVAALGALLPEIDHFIPTLDTPSNCLASNPAMAGSGGRAVDDGASGYAADAWEISYGVGSKLARSDGNLGEWQVMEIGAASVRLNPGTSVDVTTGFIVGDTVLCQAEIYCNDDWDTITQIVLNLDFRDSGGIIGSAYSCFANNPNTGNIPNPNPDGIVVLRTIPALIPTGTTAIRTYLHFVGASGTIQVGRYELKKLG